MEAAAPAKHLEPVVREPRMGEKVRASPGAAPAPYVTERAPSTTRFSSWLAVTPMPASLARSAA